MRGRGLSGYEREGMWEGGYVRGRGLSGYEREGT